MARRDPDQHPQHRKVEVPGDTGAADIVGRTGEEMPEQSHDGLDAGRSPRTPEMDEDDEDDLGYPI